MAWLDHLSIYKNGLEITKTGLPSDVITKELDEGIVLLAPVVHTIWVLVLDVIGQSIPSIVTVTVVPKLVPVIVKTVLPELGPK